MDIHEKKEEKAPSKEEKNKNKEKERVFSSNKVIEEINGHYILTDNYHIDKNLPNLNLPKFKNYKKFPPSLLILNIYFYFCNNLIHLLFVLIHLNN